MRLFQCVVAIDIKLVQHRLPSTLYYRYRFLRCKRFALREICVNRVAAVWASDLSGLLNNCMKLLVFVLFCVCCTATADTLEQNPLDTEPQQPVRIKPKPYVPPVDVRLELAQLNPQYVLEQSLDIELIQRDGQLISDYNLQARKRNPFYGLKLREPLNNAHLSLFVLMNALDVYTTVEGTSYPCVVEVNPLLPAKPSLEELVLLKSLASWLQLDPNLDGQIDATARDINTVTFVTALAVANNFDVIRGAIDDCPR